MQEKKFPSRVQSSALHHVSPILLELVAGSGEFLSNDIAQVHQVIEALLQRFKGGR